jgi:hypothetical protein
MNLVWRNFCLIYQLASRSHALKLKVAVSVKIHIINCSYSSNSVVLGGIRPTLAIGEEQEVS